MVELQALAEAEAARATTQRELQQAEKRYRRCTGEGQRSKHPGSATAGTGPGRKLQVHCVRCMDPAPHCSRCTARSPGREADHPPGIRQFCEISLRHA